MINKQILEDYKNGRVVKNEGFSIQAGKRITFKRGSWAAWSKGIIDWNYNGSRISSSDASQDSGWVFPNKVSEKGISKLKTSTSKTHKYRHKTSIAIGSPTPWGDVKFAEQGFSDNLIVRHNGTYRTP